jgi:ribosomal protein L20A (L18A)
LGKSYQLCEVQLVDDRIQRLDTPKKCEIFARNAINHGRPDLALEANQRAVELRAEEHNAETTAEIEALQAVYAYEELLYKKNGKRHRASRTWQMIKRHGVIEAVERAVKRPTVTQGYTMLVEMGLQEHAFEAVILRYTEVFSGEAIQISQQRLLEWSKGSK